MAFGKLDTGEAPRRSKVSCTHLLCASIRSRRLSAELPPRASFVDIHSHGWGRGSSQFGKRISAGVTSLNLIPKSAPAHFAISQKLVRDKAHRVYWNGKSHPRIAPGGSDEGRIHTDELASQINERSP